MGATMRFALLIVVLLFAAGGIVSASSYEDVEKMPWAGDDPAAVLVTVKASSPTASGGEPVLTVTLANISTREIKFRHVIPPLDYELDIRDARGALIEPATEGDLGDAPHHPVFLKAGESFADSASLSKWGYAPLKPGIYSVVAGLRGAKAAVRSKKIRIRIPKLQSMKW
jgi:hypothetical protein